MEFNVITSYKDGDSARVTESVLPKKKKKTIEVLNK